MRAIIRTNLAGTDIHFKGRCKRDAGMVLLIVQLKSDLIEIQFGRVFCESSLVILSYDQSPCTRDGLQYVLEAWWRGKICVCASVFAFRDADRGAMYQLHECLESLLYTHTAKRDAIVCVPIDSEARQLEEFVDDSAVIDKGFLPILVCGNSGKLGQGNSSREWILQQAGVERVREAKGQTDGTLTRSSKRRWKFVIDICRLSIIFVANEAIKDASLADRSPFSLLSFSAASSLANFASSSASSSYANELERVCRTFW